VSLLLALTGGGGGGVTGTVAYTNANDTSAATGTTTIVGTLARTNANDTSAASGTTTITGTLATTNANDSVVASGSAGAITGTVAYTNNDDTAAAVGAAGSAQPQGGGVPWNVYAPTGETEEQKRTRRLAQGIIARAKKPTADIGRLKEQAARVSGLLREDAERLDALAERYQAELRQRADEALRDTLMRARNDALATRQLEARMVQAQLQAESARQQIEELDIVFMAVMLAAL
jgi:hypothetical protein